MCLLNYLCNIIVHHQIFLGWDVNNGVSRRAWSGNTNADITIRRAMQSNPDLVVTLPNNVENEDILNNLF